MRREGYSIEWTREAAKKYNKIKDAVLQARILDIIESKIAADPLAGKPLAFVFKGIRSYRIGRLRILYKPYKDRLVIVILKVGHRKSVYRRK